MQVPKQDRLKTVGIITLMIAAYALFIYRPGIQQRKALEQRVAQLEQQTSDFERPDLDALREQAENARAQLAAVPYTLPPEHEVFLVLDGVTGSLESQGILDHTASQSDPRWYADYAVQPIHLEFTGDFTDTYVALHTIETMDHPVRIERLELTGDTNETSGYITAVVQISAFFDAGTTP
ncbi:MAG: type 4a pilus biogenesis protein PilO [Phycisphaerales bacterium JB063]